MLQNRFKNAVDAVIKAYIEDDLQPGTSCKCFIGNMMGQTTTWHKELVNYRTLKISTVTLWAGYYMREIDLIEYNFEIEATKVMVDYILNCDIIFPYIKEDLKHNIENRFYTSEDIRMDCYFIFEKYNIDRFSIDYWEAVEKTFDLLVTLEKTKDQEDAAKYLAKEKFHENYDVALKELAK